MVIKVVGWVYGEKDGDYRRVFKTLWVPVEVVIPGGDGVEGRAESGNMNQVSKRPILLETPENIIVRLVSMQVNRDDGSWSTHTVAG